MEAPDIDTIAVIGAGSMGHGIAEVAALAGYTVHLRDVSEELVQQGYEQIEQSLSRLVDSKQVGKKEAESTLERIETVVDIEETLEGVDAVIEAVPERMDIKRTCTANLTNTPPTMCCLQRIRRRSRSPNCPKWSTTRPNSAGCTSSIHQCECRS